MSVAHPSNANSLNTSGLSSHFNVNNTSGGKQSSVSPTFSPPISPLTTPRDSSSKKKKKIQTPAPQETRCLARVATGDQCKRSQTEGSVLCTCHSKNLPYGRMNESLPVKFLNLPKKRGPRFRNQTAFKMTAEIQHHYVATKVIKIDDSLYLIDELGLLYSNDKRGEIVGRRLKDEIHWYV